MGWSEDWSNSESSPCAEDVFPEQSQVLALSSDDVSSPECVQQAEDRWLRRIEPWLRPDEQWREQNKTVVVSFLLPVYLPVVRAKERAR